MNKKEKMKKVSEMSMAATIILSLTILFWVLNKITITEHKNKEADKKKKNKLRLQTLTVVVNATGTNHTINWRWNEKDWYL